MAGGLFSFYPPSRLSDYVPWESPISALGSAGPADYELWLMPPDQVRDDSSYRVTDAKKISLKLGVLLQDVLEVSVPWNSPVATTTWNGTSARRTGKGWDGWSFELYVRGTKVFDGPIIDGEEQWAGSRRPGSSYDHPGSMITLWAVPWFIAHARRRYVATATGAYYTKTDYAKNIFRDLIATSLVSGTVVTPTGWQQGSEVRYDLGEMSAAAGSAVVSGTSMTFRAEFGEPLLSALLRLCMIPDDDADKLWPTQSRSGTTVTYSCNVGRSGGSRAIGTDLGDTFLVSPERGNLAAYKYNFARSRRDNHIAGGGRGYGQGQRRRYKADATSISSYGVYENFYKVPSAATDDELDQDARRRLFEFKDGTVTHTCQIRETDGFQWPTDFGIADTLPVYTPRGEILSQLIVGLEWTVDAPGPALVTVAFGAMPPAPEAEATANGGGGAGGGGGGGPSARKSGELPGWFTINCDTGSVVAEGPQHYLEIKGGDTSTYVRIQTTGSNNTGSDSSGSPDSITGVVVGDLVLSDPAPTGTVKIRNAAGGSIWLLARDTDPLGP